MVELKKILSVWNMDIDEKRMNLFDRFYDLLIHYNSVMNLTTITRKDEVASKHFADSIALLYYSDLTGRTLIDIGTGAGFPGIPIKIMCPDCDIVLVDSLKKRVGFLKDVIDELELSGISAVHGRAEDLAKDPKFRQSFDLVTSRAVSNLRTLSEYCLPFAKPGGTFVSYKSGNIDDELQNSNNAIECLGGSFNRSERFFIPTTDYERTIIFIDKVKDTPDKYPRKAGIPLKKPL